MKNLLFCFLLATLTLIGNAQNAVKLWETPTTLEVPESVLFDDSVIYVGNIKGSPSDKDNNGYISRVSPKGEILSLKWVTGLSAPKGMAIVGKYLYVADIDRIAVIDRIAGKIDRFIDIPGTKFLNDVTSSSKGVVAVSDMNDNAIYLIKNNQYELLVKDAALQSVNGLYWEDENLFAGTGNIIYKVDVATKTLQKLIEGTGGIDGLERYSANKFIISDWAGKIQVVSSDAAPVVAVSDMNDNAIYLIKNNQYELLIKDAALQSVNGLYWEDENLFAGTGNIIYKVDVSTKTLQKMIEGTGGIDGLERYSANKFIISDWAGKIQVVSSDAAPVVVLNVASEKYNAADIDFNVKSKTLYIPTFFGNSVAAYRIE